MKIHASCHVQKKIKNTSILIRRGDEKGCCVWLKAFLMHTSTSCQRNNSLRIYHRNPIKKLIVKRSNQSMRMFAIQLRAKICRRLYTGCFISACVLFRYKKKIKKQSESICNPVLFYFYENFDNYCNTLKVYQKRFRIFIVKTNIWIIEFWNFKQLFLITFRDGCILRVCWK